MSHSDDKRFAKDVARELHRRQTRRRLAWWTILLGLVAAVAMYVRCGGGWGFGGDGKGEGEGEGNGAATHSDAGRRRCAIRIAAGGITVDGDKATRQQAVKTCKGTAGADVTITGGANEGEVQELRRALEQARIPFVEKNAPAPFQVPKPTP
jgi:hypothetical protein